MERFIFIFFCAILVWSPLPLGSNRDWSLSLLAVMTSVLFCFWLFHLRTVSQLPQAISHNKAIIFIFFLIPLWSLVQLIPLPANVVQFISPHSGNYYHTQEWHTISINKEATLYSIQRSVSYALFFVLTLGIVNTPKRLENVAQVIVICGVIQASYGVLVVTGGKSFDFLQITKVSGQASFATGTFANRNHFAGYLEMSLAIGVGLLIAHIIQNNNPYAGLRAFFRNFIFTLLSGKARLRVFLALLVVALVLSRSRMGNTAFFVSLGVSGLIGLWLYRKNSNAKSLFVLFSSLIAIDMFILGSWFGLDKLVARLEGTTMEREERPFAFESSLHTLQDFWLTGSGAGNYYSIFPIYRSNEISGFYNFAHNDFLQISIEYGLIGFVLFAGIVIYSFTRAIQAQMQRRTAILKGAGFAAMMGIMSLTIHSSTDFNLYIPANALLFTLLCAFACCAYAMEHQEHPKTKRRRSNAINH